jgi:hypothetical protein
MATTTEIRQKLIQGGIDPISAQMAAQILSDPISPNPPIGGIWDTLKAKGYNLVQRFTAGTNTVRVISNGTVNAIIIAQNGINQLYVQGDVAKL